VLQVQHCSLQSAQNSVYSVLRRYPKGESYLDLVARVSPLLEEIRDRERLVIICHQATLRSLWCAGHSGVQAILAIHAIHA
jgi:broad specificity phosphatase PhoE